MSKTLKIIGGLIVLTVALVFIFRESLTEMIFAAITDDMFVTEDVDSYDAGPAIGNHLPRISALYEGEEVTDLTDFAGENGLVVVLSRSVDWCAFCIRQAVELNDASATLRDAGVNMVLITYDSPQLQQEFIDEYGIEYTLLSDIEARSVIAFDALNQDYSPGDGAYGIPNPGTLVANTDGTVLAKWFLDGYQVRIDGNILIETSRRLLN